MIDLIVEQRQRAGLSQAQLADRLGRYQSVVSSIESGGRRVDVVELLDIAEAIGSRCPCGDRRAHRHAENLAEVIAGRSAGLCDDLVSCLVALAFDDPVSCSLQASIND